MLLLSLILFHGLLRADDLDDEVKKIDSSACMRRVQNARKIEAASRTGPDAERAPGVCMDAIKKSYEVCATTPRDPKEKKMSDPVDPPPVSVKAAGAQLKEKSEWGKGANLDKAKECEAERAKAKKVCDDARGAYKEAFERNGRERRELERSGSRDAQVLERIKGYEEVGRQLQAQMRNTKGLTDAGDAALTDYQKCYAAEAQRNQLVADRAGAIMASAGADDPPSAETPKAENDKPINHGTQPINKAADSCGLGNDADNNFCKAAGLNAVNQAKYKVGAEVGKRVLGDTFFRTGAAAAAETAAPSLIGTVGGALWRASGPVGVYLGGIGPAGDACAESYPTNYLASQKGCTSVVNQAAYNSR